MESSSFLFNGVIAAILSKMRVKLKILITRFVL